MRNPEPTEPTAINLAHLFCNQTDQSIFLTGKAGTGKTTFLKSLKAQTKKHLIVAAPTGIAAINAGGVTLHSLFQLPLSPFIPTTEGKNNLIKRVKLHSNKQQLLQELEMLIIDEVSMVRADLLDEVDTLLRRYRHRPKEPFGGVQLILIGDLYQLPPVVPEAEWNILSQFYDSPYFFDSYAIKEKVPLLIELDKIYRQSDEAYISLLNEVRANQLTEISRQLLQSRYFPNFVPHDRYEYITLTTHNIKAQRINQQELQKLPTDLHQYTAIVHGDFPERNFPAELELQLKEDAKVMFIANDTEYPRRYYNGKIGIVSHINDDEVRVRVDGEEDEIVVHKETWRNIRYRLNETDRRIEEEELGYYQQYPLRLAWAITIHKSQGLTFDKVILDTQDSFSAGQIYVALSRCRSLEGVILSSPIPEQQFAVNPAIVAFSQQRKELTELQQILTKAQNEYLCQLIVNLFSFKEAMTIAKQCSKLLYETKTEVCTETVQKIDSIQQQIGQLGKVGKKLGKEFEVLFQQGNNQQIKERISIAELYFVEALQPIKEAVLSCAKEHSGKKNVTRYTRNVSMLFQSLTLTEALIKQVCQEPTVERYLQTRYNFKSSAVDTESQKNNKIEKEQKREVSSQQLSYELFVAGKSVEDIAAERALSPGTIFSHLTPYVVAGELPITNFIEEAWQRVVIEILTVEPNVRLRDIFDALEGNVSYDQIKMVKALWEEEQKAK